MPFTAYILDVLTDSVYPARITIEDGIFKEIVPIHVTEETRIDVEGVMLPGFIDAHIHIESSMMTPAQFAKIAVRHGTTAVVCDPHEIANVRGIKGIEFMIENASTVPFNFYLLHRHAFLQLHLKHQVQYWILRISNICFRSLKWLHLRR